jgi:hypothetical protein
VERAVDTCVTSTRSHVAASKRATQALADRDRVREERAQARAQAAPAADAAEAAQRAFSDALPDDLTADAWNDDVTERTRLRGHEQCSLQRQHRWIRQICCHKQLLQCTHQPPFP